MKAHFLTKSCYYFYTASFDTLNFFFEQKDSWKSIEYSLNEKISSGNFQFDLMLYADYGNESNKIFNSVLWICKFEFMKKSNQNNVNVFG